VKIEDWPNCPTLGCPWKVCVWADTGRCAQCSVALLGEAEVQRRYDATHTDERLNDDIDGIDPEDE
jgi:hypothetical protein